MYRSFDIARTLRAAKRRASVGAGVAAVRGTPARNRSLDSRSKAEIELTDYQEAWLQWLVDNQVQHVRVQS